MRRLVVVAAVMGTVLAGCGGSDPDPSVTPSSRGDIERIVVERGDGLAPQLIFDEGLDYVQPQTDFEWEGEGALIEDGQRLLLDIYAESLVDGSVVINSFDGLPRPFLMAPELLGDSLHKALKGARVGSRLLHVAPPVDEESGEPPIALVIDVLPTRAQGTEVTPSADLPVVALEEDGEPSIRVREGEEPPGTLQVTTLIQGDGDQIKEGSYIVAQYKGINWSDGEVFDSSWDPGKAPFETQIGVGQVILGWDEGLIDQTAGSQVMLVVPPSYGYPDRGTLVFVVDILDVWNPEDR
ncbi:MAG: FKBP-type peptidyl-prolyl cis-trans isomerase [Demequina sp.]